MTNINDFGFVRVGAAIPRVKVADCTYNAEQIIEMVIRAESQGVQILTFPELSVTGYTCGDLFFQHSLLEYAENAVIKILEETAHLSITFIIGSPIQTERMLYNTAVVINSGKIIGIVPKTNLPNNNEFYEKRWFASSTENKEPEHCGYPFGTDLIFTSGGVNFGIEICEDVWVPIPPSSYLATHGADIIFNLSASNELIGKNGYLHSLIKQQSARCTAAYIYSSAGFGESSTDLVYAGNAIIAENGQILKENDRFSFEPQLVISDIDIQRLQGDRMRNTNFTKGCEKTFRMIEFDLRSNKRLRESVLERTVYRWPFVPSPSTRHESCEEIFSIQVHGLAQRWNHTQSKNIIIGISGGLDSTLALLVAVKAADKLELDRKRIVGITMPGFGTTGRTYNNALALMKSLGVTLKDIDISNACMQHFLDIEHDSTVHDLTYENSQARERTQILMDYANKVGGFVLGTGDLSELALGWATYNGDHMSMYGVNSSIPKTLVKYLVEWCAHTLDKQTEKILLDVIDTPVSPELLPANDKGEITQITEDIVGPYELHDFFLYYTIRFGFSPTKIFMLAQNAFNEKYTDKLILKWLKVFYKRFFSQQFKRSCMPDGPKVGSINLSPRGDWRMPSDASSRLWLEELDNLKF